MKKIIMYILLIIIGNIQAISLKEFSEKLSEPLIVRNNQNINELTIGSWDLSDVSGIEEMKVDYEGTLTSIKNIPNLYLEIISIRLTDISPVALTLTNLRGLSVHTNSLKTIPKEIGALKKLRRLIINSDEEIVIPWEELTNLTNLRTLGLLIPFKSIPSNISKLKNLQNLDLTGNSQLESIDGIKNLRLRALKLSNCKSINKEELWNVLNNSKTIQMLGLDLIDFSQHDMQALTNCIINLDSLKKLKINPKYYLSEVSANGQKIPFFLLLKAKSIPIISMDIITYEPIWN